MGFTKLLGVSYGFDIKQNNGIMYMVAPQIDALGVVRHGFAGRLGGASPKPYDSLNLSAKREQNTQNVLHNFKAAASAVGVDSAGLVVCNYAHGNKVEEIDEQHHGMGVCKKNTLPKCDGVFVTEKSKQTVGVTLHADCCPLFFADRKGRIAGVCHAGWKGTAGEIAVRAVKKMQAYGVPAADIFAAVGPCIAGESYEVGPEVAEQFTAYPEAVMQKGEKYYLDLATVNALQFIKAGILPAHITISAMCTYADSELFYSYRRDGTNAGAMGSFIQLI